MLFAKRFAYLATMLVLVGCGDKTKQAGDTPPDTAASVQAPPVEPVVAPLIVNMPPNLDTGQNRAQLLETMHNLDLSDSQFDATSGATIGPGSEDEATIQPHRGARDDGKVHGKLLARIRVKKESHDGGWKKEGWNYWVMAKFPDKEWEAVMVYLKPIAHGSIKVREMKFANMGTHTKAEARWMRHPAKAGRAPWVGGWVTCDGNECCCEGSSCDQDPEPLDTTKTKHPK